MSPAKIMILVAACVVSSFLLVLGSVAAVYFFVMPVLRNHLAVASGAAEPTVFAPTASSDLPSRPTPAFTPVTNLSDFDALAARMTKGHDLYVQIRDQSLAVFAQTHPLPSPTDDEVRQVIRGVAYNFVWGDRFSEGLWHVTSFEADDAKAKGAKDPILDLAESFMWYAPAYQNYPYQERFTSLETALAFQHQNSYPPPVQMLADAITVQALLEFKSANKMSMSQPGLDGLPRVLARWGETYQELVREKIPDSILFGFGDRIQEYAKQDIEGLNLVISEEDRAFNAVTPDHPVRWALDGDYQTNAAWCARGNGWANTVTDEGWRGFADCLKDARATLQTGYEKYPHGEAISRLMIRVVLGQQTGRPEMEMWFSRAIDADPDDYEAYRAKEWFLQPRWYGSVEDLLAFGQDCVKTQNWENKIPMILTRAMDEAAQLQPDIYTHPEIWTPVEKAYREFLARYPASTYYRTQFAEHAYQANKRDLAREQFLLLGDNWSREALSEDDYLRMKRDLLGN